MIRDHQLVCDSCQQPITRITTIPEEGWEKMHNLCSACFVNLWQTSISRT